MTLRRFGMHKQGMLWGQWLAPAIGGLIVVAAAYVAPSRIPSDGRKVLSISLQELRSQVAEAGLLAERGGRGDLTRTFMREHAHQLEKHMRASVDELHGQAGRSGQQALTQQATVLGGAALASLQRLADDPGSASSLQEVAARMAVTAQELSRIDRAMQRHSP